MKKLLFLVVAGLSIGNVMPLIAQESSHQPQVVSDALRKKLIELKHEARLLRGERYIDYRTTAKDMHSAFVWAAASAAAWAGAKAFGIDVETLPFVGGPVSLEAPAVLTSTLYSATQSTALYAAWYAIVRFIVYKRINEQLQMHIDESCNFKSLPFDHALLFLAAYKKDDEVLTYLKAEFAEYSARADVTNALDALYEAEQPTAENMWTLADHDTNEDEKPDVVLTGLL